MNSSGFIDMQKWLKQYPDQIGGISKYDYIYRVPNEILLSIILKSLSKAKIYEEFPESYTIDIQMGLHDTVTSKLIKEL